MVDAYLFGEAYEVVVGGEGVDVEIEYLEQVGDDDGLEGGVEGVDGLLLVLEEELQLVGDLLQSVVLLELLVEGDVVL